MKNKNAPGEGLPKDTAFEAETYALAQLVDVICRRTPQAQAAVVASPARGPWRAVAASARSGQRIASGQRLDRPEHAWMAERGEPSVGSQPLDNSAFRLRQPIVLRDGSFFGNLCLVASRADSVADAGLRDAAGVFAELAALLIGQTRRSADAEARLDNEAAAAEQRERFVAVLAHDLRTPLSTVRALGETLSIAPERANLPRIAKILLAAVARMASLIDGVLDLARARLGGGITMRWQSCPDLAERLSQIVEEARAAHPGRRIHSQIQIARAVDCDPARLQQLLGNLLDNALTHGDEGRPVSVVADANESELVIRVANEGAELDSETIAHVFEPFWRPKRSKRAEGLGLGLFICAHIATRHGGSIRVESANGATTFVFSMPNARA
ncbi:sensor histidine kinase [Candidatus Burkholderia verschuerenii]|uniref:histidine kinase n=1 Tax=Candidatus Burkholderia verschuerenii TaxID=242163 RepID=A0A0L0MBZ3_9BURK|nr:HAMP domain-containing sensor histidine kinase [Candidatus Burkholderia verschuerenii]KND59868.1 sensor histidine kinase [Candidatus Burkholderia verschuerenii]